MLMIWWEPYSALISIEKFCIWLLEKPTPYELVGVGGFTLRCSVNPTFDRHLNACACIWINKVIHCGSGLSVSGMACSLPAEMLAAVSSMSLLRTRAVLCFRRVINTSWQLAPDWPCTPAVVRWFIHWMQRLSYFILSLIQRVQGFPKDKFVWST